jgi:hypothetical protein
LIDYNPMTSCLPGVTTALYADRKLVPTSTMCKSLKASVLARTQVLELT